MISIVRGTTKKPISSQRLADYFSSHAELDGLLYLGYPIIGTPDGPFPIDALWISPEKGVVIFNLVEGRNLDNFDEIQDDSANKLESKFRNHRTLMKGRRLLVPVNVITFAPALSNIPADEDYPVANEENIEEVLSDFSWEDSSSYESLVAVIQAISTIRKGRKKRILQRDDSRGAILKQLEDSIANLDNLQGRAVIETVEGVQRIRGLAGSGKTVVLALKAAYLHAQHPDWKIAVTFHTRSLKGQFRQFINTFVIEQTHEEPDWDNLQIIQSWGAPGGGDRNGIYYSFCQAHDLEYHDFRSAKNSFGQNKAFEGVCQNAINEMKKAVSRYDVILVDEAQDFPPAFLRICYELLGTEKRLVYAYDELQNLSSKSLPSPEDIFGKNSDGTPRVHFAPNQAGKPQQDVILDVCYRNSRPVLATAHALGFGIYRSPDEQSGLGLVQMFDQHQLWQEVGYSVDAGELSDGSDVTLVRREESSPLFLEEHSPLDDLIQFHNFDSKEEQSQWLTNAIAVNLKEDELRSDDIIVINPNPLSTRREVGPIRKNLFEMGINSHLTGVDTSPDVFFSQDEESIVFTGIYRAKGNEAGMVYVINAQDCYSSYGNLASIRNRLFTAITRSKAWVRVLGVGDGMRDLVKEFNQVKENDFKLKFHYPTEEERKQLNIINRDMTAEEKRRVTKGQNDLSTLLDDLEEGRVYPEDIGTEKLARLRKLLGKDME